MGTFNKLKKNRKSSHLDEKIEFLNKELKNVLFSNVEVSSTISDTEFQIIGANIGIQTNYSIKKKIIFRII